MRMIKNRLFLLAFYVQSVFFCILAEKPLSEIIKDTELVSAFLVHRHGDRTPTEPDFTFSNHPEELARIVEKYGYGELTPRGKYRGYQIGQFIKRRYSSLLSCNYNSSEIYIRSTDVTRTKMTTLLSMSAVYPAHGDNWSEDINWTPVPYTTVPEEMDYNSAIISCPKFYTYYSNYRPKLTNYQDILDMWSQIIGYDLSDPLTIYGIYDLYYCQRSLGYALSKQLEAIFPKIEKVTAAALNVVFENEQFLPLCSGVLLNEFFQATSKQMSGKLTPRLRVYSAHDLNVYGMMVASSVPAEARPFVPKFGALFSLELRRVKNNGRYVVLPVYLPDPSSSELIIMPIKGCSNLCDYDIFKNITSKVVLDEKAWKEKCRI